MKNVRFECQKDDCCTKNLTNQKYTTNNQNLNVQSHDFIIVQGINVF